MGALRGSSIPDAGNDVDYPRIRRGAEGVCAINDSADRQVSDSDGIFDCRNEKLVRQFLAAVDERGYLVPILTATELLHELKALWKAAQD